MRVIDRTSAAWPEGLTELGPKVAPARLHLSGRDLPAMQGCVAIVGARRPTSAGLFAAEALSKGLAEAGFTIVSGLAIGIDTAAHRAALDVGGTTIAVLGCGLDVEYPSRNRALKAEIVTQGSLVSEYEAGVQPQTWHFPERNRIVAGLSCATVFVEGTLRSGGLITARLALDADRLVFAVPGSVRNSLAAGPNELIRSGRAGLVTEVSHVLEELAPGMVWSDQGTASRETPIVGALERDVLELLDDAPTDTETIRSQLEVSEGELLLTLARLEVRGWAQRWNGGYAITSGGARVRAIP
jgi:DNA processing protein